MMTLGQQVYEAMQRRFAEHVDTHRSELVAGCVVDECTTSSGYNGGAIFSPDRRHRYRLWRRTSSAIARCLFIGQNPSKAGAKDNDMTITKCLGFAERIGSFGIVEMVNQYSLVETDSEKFWASEDRVGRYNDDAILDAMRRLAFVPGSVVIAAWGGVKVSREEEITKLARFAGVERIMCLGTTRDGSPRHPSRLPYSYGLEMWCETRNAR